MLSQLRQGHTHTPEHSKAAQDGTEDHPQRANRRQNLCFNFFRGQIMILADGFKAILKPHFIIDELWLSGRRT